MIKTQLDTYVNSLIPEPYIILGVQLKPFCLGHIFLMRKFNCKFSADDPNTMGGIDDLLLAISICSRTYEEFIEWINNSKEFNEWCKEWGKKIKKYIKKNKRTFNLFECFSLFKDYMKNGVITPKYWETQNTENTMESGAHWTQIVLNVLVSELGYSQSEALNISVAKALLDYFKCLENNGIINLMNDDELELIEENK